MRLNSKILPALLMLMIMCGSIPAYCAPIPVPVLPTAGFNITPPSGLPPLTVQVTDTSVGATSYQYNFGDNTPNSTMKNPAHTYVTAKTYTVIQTVFNANGSSSTSKQVFVGTTPPSAAPIAGFNVVPSSGSPPLTVQVTDTSSGATSYQYSFGDNTPNSTMKNPAHTYVTAKTYTITQTVFNAQGSSTTTRQVVVGLTATPTSTPTATPGSLLPVAGFNVVPPGGVPPLTVHVTDTSSGATSYQYSFGDNTPNATTANPAHTYVTAKTYTVIQTVFNSHGSSTTTRQVTVGSTPLSDPPLAAPVAGFNVVPVSGIIPLTVQVTDTSVGATSWQYNFGDGTPNVTTQNPMHTYPFPPHSGSTYTITQTVFNANGSSSTTRLVTVTSTPAQNGSIIGLKYFDVNKNGVFDNGDFGLSNWTIRLDDPQTHLTNTSGNFNFSVVPGTYNISEVLQPGYTNTSPTSMIITVNPGQIINVTALYGLFGNTNNTTPILPVAGFNVTPQNGTAPLTVHVTDTSTGATSWQYYFGDNTPNATTPNPSHTYPNNGTYVITQTVTNINGSASTSHVVIVGGSTSNVTPVDLGAVCSDNLTILAKSGISNVPTSTILGNIGVSPIASTAITGFSLVLDGSGTFATSSQVSGKVYAANYAAPTPAMLTNDVNAMQAAYTDAAGRPNPVAVNLGAGEIGGFTLPGGVYKWTSGLSISTADLTLDGGGNPNAVWIFQIGSGLSVGSGRKVILTNGAQAKNVFWQVGSTAVIGTNAQFNGVILAQAAINMQTGATNDGNLLAQTDVTLDTNTVSPGLC